MRMYSRMRSHGRRTTAPALLEAARPPVARAKDRGGDPMTVDSPVVLEDLNDPDVFVRGVPHETFAHWRRTDPVHLTAHPEGHSYWSVTGYDDVVTASR